MVQKILIRGTNWIGDAIMTFPALSYLKQLYPQAQLDLMARPWVSPVYRCHPDVHQVLECPAGSSLIERLFHLLRFASKAKGKGYEMGVALPNSFESALVLRLAGIGDICGYATDFRSILLKKAVPVPRDKEERHHVFYYLGLVRALARSDIEPDPSVLKLKLRLPRKEQEKARTFLNMIRLRNNLGADSFFAGFNPGAAFGPAKCWPSSRFSELASLLLKEFPNLHILVFGTEKEQEIAEEIKKEAPGRISNLCGATTLLEAVALINQLHLLVTNDSGLMHVGAACAIPLVAIFGSTNPTATGPWSDKARVISLDLECAPCMSRKCTRDFKCMLGISAENVFSACKEMLLGHSR